ncbi:hypothetical protein ACS0TY_027778 [Phlomoides rotata]
MVRGSGPLLKSAGAGISTTLAEILVCPLSKQPLRLCEKTNSLISDTVGVSYPIVDGIPRLVPADGKILDADQHFNPPEAISTPQKLFVFLYCRS